MLETLTRPAEYGPGNPLPLQGLKPESYKTKEYCLGEKLRAEGKASVADAAFIQVMGMRAGEGQQIASISRDLPWDGQTRIEAFGEALAAEIAQMPVRPEWFGPYQFTVYIEGDLNPEEVVNRLVYSPTKVYAQYMGNLSPEAEQSEYAYEDSFLIGPDSKGKRFTGIHDGILNGQTRALQSGKGFVWGYQKTENDEMQAIDLGYGSQTITELTETDEMDQDMKDSLLATQGFFRGVSNHGRWIIRFTFDPTRTCCLNASAVSEANFHKGPNFESSAAEIRLNNENLFNDLLNPSLLKSEKDEEGVCSKCNMSKNGSSEGGKCTCKES